MSRVVDPAGSEFPGSTAGDISTVRVLDAGDWGGDTAVLWRSLLPGRSTREVG